MNDPSFMDPMLFPQELSEEFRKDTGRRLAAAMGEPNAAKLQVMLELAIGSLVASGAHPDLVHQHCAETCAEMFVRVSLGLTSRLEEPSRREG